MADGLFVVNASPLILLAAIAELPLLPKLAGEVLVAAAVLRVRVFAQLIAGSHPGRLSL